MRKLTKFEALELLEAAWNIGPEEMPDTQIEVTLGDMGVDQVKTDIASYFAFLDADIDPDSIGITADHVEGSSIPATTLIIQVQS